MGDGVTKKATCLTNVRVAKYFVTALKVSCGWWSCTHHTTWWTSSILYSFVFWETGMTTPRWRNKLYRLVTLNSRQCTTSLHCKVLSPSPTLQRFPKECGILLKTQNWRDLVSRPILNTFSWNRFFFYEDIKIVLFVSLSEFILAFSFKDSYSHKHTVLRVGGRWIATELLYGGIIIFLTFFRAESVAMDAASLFPIFRFHKFLVCNASLLQNNLVHCHVDGIQYPQPVEAFSTNVYYKDGTNP